MGPTSKGTEESGREGADGGGGRGKEKGKGEGKGKGGESVLFALILPFDHWWLASWQIFNFAIDFNVVALAVSQLLCECVISWRACVWRYFSCSLCGWVGGWGWSSLHWRADAVSGAASAAAADGLPRRSTAQAGTYYWPYWLDGAVRATGCQPHVSHHLPRAHLRWTGSRGQGLNECQGQQHERWPWPLPVPVRRTVISFRRRCVLAEGLIDLHQILWKFAGGGLLWLCG